MQASIGLRRPVSLTRDLQFVDIGSRECYVGMLYACYDLVRYDVVMELSWRKGLSDFTMVRLAKSLPHAPVSDCD